jgi:alpha-ribazole phosphatase
MKSAKIRRGAPVGQSRPELILIRHAPVAVEGILAGRTDVPARIDPQAIAALRAGLPEVCGIRVSPAQRCVMTAQAIWPGAVMQTDARLWEQDFGTQEGMAYADLPDLGEMSVVELAALRAPEGESFADLCARVAPALSEAAQAATRAQGPLAVVAHAGVVRAALALVTGTVPGALAFDVAPLSVTRIGVFEGRAVSIGCVNRGAV